MTNEDLIQGLKEQQVKSLGRVHRLLEKVCLADHEQLDECLNRVREEQRVTEHIVYQLQLLGGA